MSLKVKSGVSGRVKIVKKNSITGEKTGEYNFKNIFTDFWLDKLSIMSRGSYPSYLAYGTGVHPEPHNHITSLAQYKGYVNCAFSGTAKESEITIKNGTLIFTRQKSATIGAQGNPWVLTELGLTDYRGNQSFYTYTLTKNEAGEPEEIPVADFEVLTVFYTLQFQYPMEFSQPFGGGDSGLPVGTATFKLKPSGSPGTSYFLSSTPSLYYYYGGDTGIRSFLDENFSGQIRGSYVSGEETLFRTDVANRENGFFGINEQGANHIWVLNPPILKNDTQELKITSEWIFKNATYIEVA